MNKIQPALKLWGPSPIFALKLFFLTQALGLSLWLLRIPEVKSTIGLTLIDLSLALFMQPFGVLVGFFIAPYLIRKIGNKKSCLYFGAIFIFLFSLIPFAKTFFTLSVILFVSGLVCAAAEVSMNAIAAQMEQEYKTRMMSRFHSFWSIGALLAGIIVTILSTLSVSFLTQQLLIIPPLIFLALAAASALPNYRQTLAKSQKKIVRKLLPSYAIIILCITPFGALLLEGALMEWTAVFKRDYQGLDDIKVGFIFCSFAITMALSRYSGDYIIDQLSIDRTIILSIILSGLGMLLYALSASVIPSMIGAAMVGAGIANIYPITMTLAASEPGSKEKNVSVVAFVSFTSFLLGPPLIGFVGEYFGLSIALTIIAPASLCPLFYLLEKNKKKLM